MPGPVIQSKLSEQLKPENESVFDPLYVQLLRKAMGVFGDPTDIVGSLGPSPLVAGVTPNKIPALRQAGKNLLEKIKSSGVERRLLGSNKLGPDQISIIRAGGNTPDELQKYLSTNVPLPDDAIKALEHAQKRYPRIFGHLRDITDVDEHFKSKAGYGKIIHGTSGPYSPRSKFSTMGLNVKSDDLPFTVGHELHHTASRLVDPKGYSEKYNFSQSLPGGYDANPWEILANLQGEKFRDDVYKAYPETVPNPKSHEGKSLVNLLFEAMGL